MANAATAPRRWPRPICLLCFSLLLHPFLCFSGFHPLAGHLASRDVEPVPHIGERDGERQSGRLALAEMASRLIPHLVGPVRDPGSGFGQGEGAPFHLSEIRGVAPGELVQQRSLVEKFLAALPSGDSLKLMEVLDPSFAVHADATAAPGAGSAEIHGAEA